VVSPSGLRNRGATLRMARREASEARRRLTDAFAARSVDETDALETTGLAFRHPPRMLR
jgi:hypothetical protein